MMQVMESIFGPYTLVDGGTNYQYIGAVVLFGIVVWCVFRLIGMVFNK